MIGVSLAVNSILIALVCFAFGAGCSVAWLVVMKGSCRKLFCDNVQRESSLAEYHESVPELPTSPKSIETPQGTDPSTIQIVINNDDGVHAERANKEGIECDRTSIEYEITFDSEELYPQKSERLRPVQKQSTFGLNIEMNHLNYSMDHIAEDESLNLSPLAPIENPVHTAGTMSSDSDLTTPKLYGRPTLN